MRLDRFLTQQTRESSRQVRQFLLAGRVCVDGVITRDGSQKMAPMLRVTLDDRVLQGGQAKYFMLHKPIGVVSATKDDKHRTVTDLFAAELRADLHIAGRLDLNTTGLMLLTNDGRWSRRVTQPETRIPKVYHVQTEDPIEAGYAEVFKQGIHFAYEGLTTLPADLDLLSSHSARLTLFEGRYHQVKRMFGYFDNKVIGLHREKIGGLVLDPKLQPGEYRQLSTEEIAMF
ncbi:pseudouridine synthase [Pontibacterium sp.]|uniref:pseudouridine synthase n=1 Tax=Pontibacterium sp. TaxID=2036026 RepID=UPI0035178E61